ncbi:MAG TPA: AsmA family protein, partial [Afifellaceae bacterium]|nr:AsmA family protein [Afifellaceae bacterium]
MRRLVVLAAAVIALIGGLLLMVPVLLPKDAVKTRIAEQISAWTGRAVSVRGDPIVSVFPDLKVQIDDVTIAGPPAMRDAELAEMESLGASVRLLPLLIGDIEFAAFVLIDPKIRLVRDEADKRNWLFDSSVAALQLAFTGDVRLGAFTVVNGRIDFEDRLTGRRETLTAVNLEIDWRSANHPFALSGSATWQGEPFSVEAGARDPVSFIKGRQTPFTAGLDAAPMKIDFDGIAAGVKNTRLGGQLDLSSPSLRRLVGWISEPLAEGASLASLTISGEAAIDKTGLDVSNARVSLDGNIGTGGLRIGFGDRPVISGTLASQSLDLTTYLTDLGSLWTSEDWKSETIDPDWLRRVDADIRLSSEQVIAGRLSLGKTATAILVENGVLEVGIAQAAFYGGVLTGRLSLADKEDGARAQAQIRANGFSLAEAGKMLDFDRSFSGQSTIAGDLSSDGATMADLIANMDGAVTIGAAAGALPGFGLDAVAASMRTGVPILSIDTDSGARPAMVYRTVDASLRFLNRAAYVKNARLETDDFSVDLNGLIALKNGAVDLAGNMLLPDAGGSARSFRIKGTVLEP